MNFYDFNKFERTEIVEEMYKNILSDIQTGKYNHIFKFFSEEDTYIRKNAYILIGRIYNSNNELQTYILKILEKLFSHDNPVIRQSAINTAGEIGISDFQKIEFIMEKGLYDEHHKVRNAVIGSIKKMGEKNPTPVLTFAKRFLHHKDEEIRREICHGIELFGRKHPQEILPLLKELENDKTARVRNTLIHVIGQISYKKGCLETVIKNLNTWSNQDLVEKAIIEIIDVHERYKNFSAMSKEQAVEYIEKNFKIFPS